MKKVLKPLYKSVLIPLGLAASPTDATIQKKVFGDMNDMEITKFH